MITNPIHEIMRTKKFVPIRRDTDVTLQHHSDREAFRCIGAAEDGKNAYIARYTPKPVSKNPGSNDYVYDNELGRPMLDYDNVLHIKYSRGKWRDANTKAALDLAVGVRDEYYDWSF